MPDRIRSDLIGTTSDVLTSSARKGKKEKKNWFARHVRSVSCLLINQSVISFIICMHRIGLSRRVASWLTSMMHADAPYRHASILSRDITHIYIHAATVINTNEHQWRDDVSVFIRRRPLFSHANPSRATASPASRFDKSLGHACQAAESLPWSSNCIELRFSDSSCRFVSRK